MDTFGSLGNSERESKPTVWTINQPEPAPATVAKLAAKLIAIGVFVAFLYFVIIVPTAEKDSMMTGIVQTIFPVTQNRSAGWGFGAISGDNTAYQINLGSLEKKVHALVNAQRKSNSINELVWDERLAVIGRNHSEDMMKRNYVAHNTPEGDTPKIRGEKAGYVCNRMVPQGYVDGIAENIQQRYTATTVHYNSAGIETGRDYLSEDEMATAIVNDWLNSPLHRQNLLTDYYVWEGIGIAISPGGKVYITEEFC